MRIREPLLYEQYIGQYLTDEEVSESLPPCDSHSIPSAFLSYIHGAVLRLIPQIFERSQEAMKANSAAASDGGTPGLASLLLNTYQEQLIQTRLQEEQEKEECAREEDEDDESDGKRERRAQRHLPDAVLTLTPRPSVPATDDAEQRQQQDEKLTVEEKALLREEFTTQMHQRFLDGKDKDFDYRLNSNLNFFLFD